MLQKAKENAQKRQNDAEDILSLEKEPRCATWSATSLFATYDACSSLPSLDPGVISDVHDLEPFLPASSRRDPALAIAEKATSSLSVPQAPVPPPELTKSGKPLTKREKKEVHTV